MAANYLGRWLFVRNDQVIIYQMDEEYLENRMPKSLRLRMSTML